MNNRPHATGLIDFLRPIWLCRSRQCVRLFLGTWHLILPHVVRLPWCSSQPHATTRRPLLFHAVTESSSWFVRGPLLRVRPGIRLPCRSTSMCFVALEFSIACKLVGKMTSH